MQTVFFVCFPTAVTLLYEILSAHRGRALAAHHPLHDACHLAGRHPHSVLNPADQHLPQSRCTKPAAVLKLLSKQLRSQTPLADACTQLFHQPRCTVLACQHLGNLAVVLQIFQHPNQQRVSPCSSLLCGALLKISVSCSAISRSVCTFKSIASE